MRRMGHTGQIEDARVRIGLRPLLIIGGALCCAAIMAFADLEPGAPVVTRAAAVTFLMALWWLTGALPLAVTALLPVVLYPTLGIMSATAVPVHYMNDVIFLFLGGFLVALAMPTLGRRILGIDLGVFPGWALAPPGAT